MASRYSDTARAIAGPVFFRTKWFPWRTSWKALGVPLRGRRRLAQQGHVQGRRDGPCDVVLHGEDVVEDAVVGFGPEVKAVRDLDELGGDPDTIPRLPHAALEECAHAQLLADVAQVLLLALERERGRAPRHLELRNLRQNVEELLG